MPPPITPSLVGRRLVVSGLAATLAGPLIPGRVGLAQTTSLLPTPRQTTGPFYPVDWSGDADADLVRVLG
jgi:protocatechuate 3,4-dioxygenase beta subunit